MQESAPAPPGTPSTSGETERPSHRRRRDDHNSSSYACAAERPARRPRRPHAPRISRRRLARIDRATGVGRIGEIVARVQPDTILTFGPDGMTGHSDHITVGEWAVEAAAARAPRYRALAATKTPEWLDRFGHEQITHKRSTGRSPVLGDPPLTCTYVVAGGGFQPPTSGI